MAEGVGTEAASRVLLIAGPTASGKSALALDLAERLGGEVINADSMQVYAGLPILSAQPSAADRARAPHRLFGHIDPAETYSVGRWLADVVPAIAATRAAGRIPILVGGTGLYFKALTQGLSAIPAVPEAVRAAVRAEAEGEDAATLHARLAALDPMSAARLRPSDPQRILRAIEVVLATGRSIVQFQASRTPPALPPGTFAGVVLQPERDVLRAAIADRFAAMLAAGAEDEVAALAARRLDPALPAMRALGVPPLLALAAGTMTREAATMAAVRDTRAYARRQMTFARHQLAAFVTTVPEDAPAALRRADEDRPGTGTPIRG